MDAMTETSAEQTIALERPARSPSTTARVTLAILRAPFAARTWKDLVYLIAALPLGCLVCAYLFFAYGAGVFTSVVVLGIPLLATVLLSGRVWGQIYRALGRALLDLSIEEPRPLEPEPGLLGWLRGVFTDGVAYRVLLFLILEAVLGVGVGYLVLTGFGIAAFTALSPIVWAVFHPTNVDSQGRERHSMLQFGDYYFDTWPRMLLLGLVGVLVFYLVVPWLIRGTAWAHRLLMLVLLAPTARERRMAELREGRRVAVADSTATLRRLERDLHDGTQARLVTIAMTLGRAEDRMATGADPTQLIADARASSKEAITELRELVRGIHPPALELGLEPALETLAARCAVPVELRVRLPRRPVPAIEAIAYFSAAELLTNVVKHSGADRVWVAVLPSGSDGLVLTVRDNGHGGARQPTLPTGEAVVGGGLSGLAARARSVDGTLTVDSPPGGPTVVTLTLPIGGPQ
ncbi:histidine kinase [Nocardia terpenica]|uniref:histidine kinase n=2 Tax=Nocardia terpenica TaxID=455432 RepID=A0A164IWC1_9NOCA|nr:histidine kinase [Nocardia terpenica]